MASYIMAESALKYDHMKISHPISCTFMTGKIRSDCYVNYIRSCKINLRRALQMKFPAIENQMCIMLAIFLQN